MPSALYMTLDFTAGLMVGGGVSGILASVAALRWGTKSWEQGYDLCAKGRDEALHDQAERHDREVQRLTFCCEAKDRRIADLQAKLDLHLPPPLTAAQLAACLAADGTLCPRCGATGPELDFDEAREDAADSAVLLQDGRCSSCSTGWRLMFRLAEVRVIGEGVDGEVGELGVGVEGE